MFFLGSNDTVESYGRARQATSDDEEVYYVNQEHYRREKNAFRLAKLALEVERPKRKRKKRRICGQPHLPDIQENEPFSSV